MAAVCILQAVPMPAAARERGAGTIIEIAPRTPRPPANRAGAVDRSGRARDTQATVLSDPSLAAADAVGISGILPEGTTVRVQNLQNGRTTLVRVQAGGAAGESRLLDITPPVARALGVTGSSAQVRVAPLAVPQPDGSIRLGEGTRLAGATAAPAVSDRPAD